MFAAALHEKKCLIFEIAGFICLVQSNRAHLSHRLHTLGSLGSREKLRPIRKLRSSRGAELCRVGMVLRERKKNIYRGDRKPKHFRAKIDGWSWFWIKRKIRGGMKQTIKIPHQISKLIAHFLCQTHAGAQYNLFIVSFWKAWSQTQHSLSNKHHSCSLRFKFIAFVFCNQHLKAWFSLKNCSQCL